MALTALVKEELAQYEASKASVRKAEVSTILRFTGALHIVAGRIVIESEVDTEQTAQRMQQTIAEIYGHESELTSVTGGGLRRGGRYIVRVDSGGEALARQTGLLDLRGRPVRGLPPAVVNGSLQDAEAVMRGAFLAHGSLTEPGRSSAIEFTCPGPEAALALVGAARRLDVMAKAREVRGVMAHELAHVKHRDILISTISATMAGAISALANFAMFFGGRDEEGRPTNPIASIAMAILAPLAAPPDAGKQQAAERSHYHNVGNGVQRARIMPQIHAIASDATRRCIFSDA